MRERQSEAEPKIEQTKIRLKNDLHRDTEIPNEVRKENEKVREIGE